MRLPAIRLASLSVLALVAAAALAQDADAARERQRIAADRSAAEARYAERQHACVERFVVTSCIEDAKRERREALSRARREQNQLDDRLRKARAAERTEAIGKRQAAEAQAEREAALRKAGEPATAAAPERGRRTAKTAEPDGSRLARDRKAAPHAAQTAAKAIEGSDDAARNRTTFDAAQRAAEAHRVEVEERNARRAATHKPAAPLPLPLPQGASTP